MSFSILGIKFKDAHEVVLSTVLSKQVDASPVTLTPVTLTPVTLMSLAPKPVLIAPVAYTPITTSDVKNDDDDANDSESSFASTDTEYYMYSRVETHMRISMSLFHLNKEGQEILVQLESKKKAHRYTAKAGRSILQTIHAALSSIINFQRMSYDLYCDLTNTLDGILCQECGDIDMFYVKEEAFTIESMYYRQETWIDEFETFPNTNIFEFAKGDFADLGECSYLLLYLRKYSALIDMIEGSFDCNRIHDITTKMKDKLHPSMVLLQNKVEELLNED